MKIEHTRLNCRWEWVRKGQGVNTYKWRVLIRLLPVYNNNEKETFKN